MCVFTCDNFTPRKPLIRRGLHRIKLGEKIGQGKPINVDRGSRRLKLTIDFGNKIIKIVVIREGTKHKRVPQVGRARREILGVEVVIIVN